MMSFTGVGLVSLSIEDWKSLWGDEEDKFVDVYDGVVEMYGEPGRFYHTLGHVDACLVEFDRVSGSAVHSFEVRLALWFHDVVYDPGRGDNVERSVDYAVDALAGLIDDASLSRVCDLIYATRHDGCVSGWDMGLVVDIDLSILGKPWRVFEKYEEEIRKEYSWVPLEDYCKGRAGVLGGFLDRDFIYYSGYFRWRYEERARCNLAYSIECLMKQIER